MTEGASSSGHSASYNSKDDTQKKKKKNNEGASGSGHSSSLPKDEDPIKKNTDCVYFLASPFTCNKGIECEYRHSEGARLNPRDCYFWLAGNCLNPTCEFRHLPINGGPEPYLDPAGVLPNHPPPPPLHGNNRNTPCYFFSNGYCKHGEACWFMHGRGPAAPPARVSSPDCIEVSVESDAPLPAEDSSDDSLNTESPQRKEEGQVEKDGIEQEGESTLVDL